MSVASGSTVSVSGVSASVSVSEVLEVSGAEMVVRAAERMSAYSGESVSLSTQDVDVSAGGSVSAFAGESASLVSGRVSVSASESRVGAHARVRLRGVGRDRRSRRRTWCL